jgi:hypothetical protein
VHIAIASTRSTRSQRNCARVCQVRAPVEGARFVGLACQRAGESPGLGSSVVDEMTVLAKLLATIESA